MKRWLLFVLIVLGFNDVQAQHVERRIRLVEPDRQVVNKSITHIVSIDKVLNDTVLAYATDQQLAELTQLGYRFEVIAPEENAPKSLMANTLSEMTNWDRYPTYDVYCAMVQRFADDYPTLCTLDSVGTTVNGRQLYALKLSDNAGTHEAEPEILLTSTMHGDETTGFVLLLRLVDHLLKNYESDTEINNLLNTSQLYIIPNTNPDGTYAAGNFSVTSARRFNANSVDLNRNFPSPTGNNHPDNNQWQPETLAMMAFAQNHNFVLGANVHGGSELLNYPWDCWEQSENPHADDSWFQKICRAYVDSVHKIAPTYLNQCDSGVTQGAAWYVVLGGRQDYMNFWHGCREITIEISERKCPSATDLPTYWNWNHRALLQLLQKVHNGFDGTVKNIEGAPLKATVHVLNHDKDGSWVRSDSTHGHYFRPIDKGKYLVKYSATGYYSHIDTIIVENENSSTVNNVILKYLARIKGKISDSTTGKAIPNARIEIPGLIDVFSNDTGSYKIDSIYPGIFTTQITKRGYRTRTCKMQVDTGYNALNIKLIPETYTVKVQVHDEANHAVEKAQIDLDGTRQSTNSKGLATFTNVSHKERSTCTVIKTGFTSKSTDYVLYSDTLLPIMLRKNTCTVTFEVSSQGHAVPKASIEFNRCLQQTDETGKTTFSGIPRATQIDYTIKKERYANHSGTIFTNNDTTISIDLTLNGLNRNPMPNIELWPNPFDHELHIDLKNLTGKEVTISIFNMIGQKIATLQNQGNSHRLHWLPAADTPKGIYLIIIENKGKRVTKKVIYK